MEVFSPCVTGAFFLAKLEYPITPNRTIIATTAIPTNILFIISMINKILPVHSFV
jgi:hypothetical protein